MAYTMADALVAANDCLKLAEEVFDKSFEKTSEPCAVARLFLARAGQSMLSVCTLAQKGLNADAMSVARTIVEMDIDLAYISTDPELLIQKLRDYDDVTAYRLAQAVEKLHEGKVPQHAMQTLKELHDAARTNNPQSTRNWAGISIYDRAERVGRIQNYELLYADMCTASHSCYGTLRYAIVGEPDDPRMHWGPLEPDTKAIMLAFGALVLIIETAAKICEFDYAGRIAELMNRLKVAA